MKPISAANRKMFEDLERQVKAEAARQRAIATIIGTGAQQQGNETTWQQNELTTGISSILAAFSKRETSEKAKSES